MNLEFAVVGGQLSIDKGVFAKEMLSKESRLRSLVNAGNLVNKPVITKNDSDDTYIIDYSHSTDVPLSESYEEIFAGLQADYPGKIRGRLTIRVTTYLSSFFTTLTLD